MAVQLGVIDPDALAELTKIISTADTRVINNKPGDRVEQVLKHTPELEDWVHSHITSLVPDQNKIFRLASILTAKPNNCTLSQQQRWHEDTPENKTYVVQVYLTDVTVKNGLTEFRVQEDNNKSLIGPTTDFPGARGSIVGYPGSTLHRGRPNLTNDDRSILALAFAKRDYVFPFLTVGCSPEAITLPATNITTTTATLNGTADAINQPNWLAHFSYTNLTTSVTLTTGDEKVPGDSVPHAQNVNITGLTPGTTYSFFLHMSDGSSTTDGSTLTFTTASTPSSSASAGVIAAASIGGAVIVLVLLFLIFGYFVSP